MPQSIGTFLVDGAVAGTWKLDGDRVSDGAVQPSWDAGARRELEEEAERLSDFHG